MRTMVDLTNRNNNDKRMELIGQIVDIFEDFLEEKGVTLENDEREEDEEPALIYGTDYGWLQQDLEDLIDNWHMHAELRGC